MTSVDQNVADGGVRQRRGMRARVEAVMPPSQHS